MAGCYGNSFWDRNMESQLMRHLADEENFSDFAERLFDEFNNQFWYINEDWCLEYDGQFNKWLNKLYSKRWACKKDNFPDFKHLAKVIERAYNLYIKK